MVVWIKAHVGHEGNKEADRMAKLGTVNSDKHIQVGTPQAEIVISANMYAGYGMRSGKPTPRVSIRRNFTRIIIKTKQKHYLHSHVLNYLAL